MKKIVLTGLLALFIMLPSSGLKAKVHPFGWDDMWSMIRLGDAQPSPDGQWILFSRKQYDLEKNKGNNDLGLVSWDGKTVRRLTSNEALDAGGRWLPDGSGILFISTRSGSAQIWKLPLAGGEANQVSDLPVDIDGFKLSPDGKQILFWSHVFVDCKDLACTAKRLKEKEESPVKARVFDKIFIRHWDTWKDGRRNHLFVLPLAGGKPRPLMGAMEQDCPTIPWGGGEEIAWSPDSKTVAFASKPSKGEAWHTNTEIYLVPATGNRKPRLLTGDNPAWDTGPVFSPDGKTLAYLAMERPGYESDRFHIVLMDIKSGKKRHLTKGWDRSVRSISWSNDNRTLYATAAEMSRVRVFSVDVDSGKVTTLVSPGRNSGLQLTKNGQLIFMRERMTHPREIFAYDPQTKQTRQITQMNSEQLKNARMSEPEEFWFENDGMRIHGWLLKPVGYRKGRKYPLAFLIHGGPQGNFGDSFHYRWNPQFYAGAGYAVVTINFRGSTSYGQKFTDAIRGNWGEGPYSDLMAGLNFALKKYRFIDKTRMCALGASYGGYMVNWLSGQDHPFQCLINHDGEFDTVAAYFNTEELWFPEWDMTGTPWEKREVYERNSPMKNVHKWKTPMLVIHGAKDYRVVESEGFSTFNALQRLGIPSKLLYFPDENHWVLKPQNSKLWHKTVLNWLDRWTKTKGKNRG